MARTVSLVPLHELAEGQEADFFACLSAKERLTAKNGKPYHRVAFRDARREIKFPIWNDSEWAEECRDQWQVGGFYKLRAVYRDTAFGPQLEIHKIRPVCEADAAEGFSAEDCRPRGSRQAELLFAELTALLQETLQDQQLLALALDILRAHEAIFCALPASRGHHHLYPGGLLEHTLSVARVALWLADWYAEAYPDVKLSRDLTLVGAVLHDIGKLRELEPVVGGVEYNAVGELVGHVVLGRDLIREAAARVGLPGETQLRLEHVVLSHQGTPEHGSPRPPMTPEALLVHHADLVDTQFHMAAAALLNEPRAAFTSAQNPLRRRFYRGAPPADAS